FELKPAQPAKAHLTFTATPGARVNPIPLRSQVRAQPPEGGDAIVFETEQGLDLITLKLSDVLVYDGVSLVAVTNANEKPGTTLRPFGWQPQAGSALYLGFEPPKTNATPGQSRFFPQQMRFRVFLPIEARIGVAQSIREVREAPLSSVRIEWEYRDAPDSQSWQPLNLYEDETAAFIREGYMLVEGPADIEPSVLTGDFPEPRYWLRCRLARGSYPAGQAPVIDFIRPNTVPAESLTTVRDELIGESEGHPSQIFKLRHKPVDAASLRLQIAPPPAGINPIAPPAPQAQQEVEYWERRDDLLASSKSDPHYVLNATTGELRFGDGQNGRIPPAGWEVIAEQYRYGGGAAGNVDIGLITSIVTSLPGVEKVTNERPAVGGGNEESLEHLKRHAPARLRCRERAVTPEDYAVLAAGAGGVAKATAIPLMHPDHKGVEVAGAVTVVIVPTSYDPADSHPEPSSELIRSVCLYLDRFRLLTTEVYVKKPEYKEVKVTAMVLMEPYSAAGQVERDVIDALNAYLDPLGRSARNTSSPSSGTGKGASNGLSRGTEPGRATSSPPNDQEGPGWRFGQDLFPTNLYAVIKAVPGVQSIKSLYITVGIEQISGTKLFDSVELPADGLFYGGAHTIQVLSAPRQ
ncbi:MAG TPA: putative baseplate assembly protein, partial [Abditibacteriaceae bacterium]